MAGGLQRRMGAVLLLLGSMPLVDAGCTCKYFDAGGSDCSCGKWTREWWGGNTCTSGGDGFWADCDKKTKQGDCESAKNVFGEEFCKWETRAQPTQAPPTPAPSQKPPPPPPPPEPVSEPEPVPEPVPPEPVPEPESDSEPEPTFSTAAERSECLAADGGSCDKCCKGITGTCQVLTVSKFPKIITTLDDKDDCVLVAADHNIVHVTLPRPKLPRLFVHPRVA